MRKNWLLPLSGLASRAKPSTPGQKRGQAVALPSTVSGITASGWLSTGRAPISPSAAPDGWATCTNGAAWSRRKVNSAFTFGRVDPPVPSSLGSPVWSMNPSITRKKLRPS